MEIEKEQQLIYLTRRKAEVLQLKEKMLERDFDMALMIGHRLKGHGETFGFPEISSIGFSLEEAAKERDMNQIQKIISALNERVEEDIKKLH